MTQDLPSITRAQKTNVYPVMMPVQPVVEVALEQTENTAHPAPQTSPSGSLISPDATILKMLVQREVMKHRHTFVKRVQDLASLAMVHLSAKSVTL